jgi:CubicO group peptidase (beta-lactamase class C family)
MLPFKAADDGRVVRPCDRRESDSFDAHPDPDPRVDRRPTEDAGEDVCRRRGAAQVVALLEPIRRRHDLPALAGAIVTAEGPVAVGAVGLRRHGAGPPVTVHDTFHLGSATKSMTATLLATFVEEGKLSWETTLAGALPELADLMDPGYRTATIQQLLAHRAGFPEETAVPGMSLGRHEDLRRPAVGAAPPVSPPDPRRSPAVPPGSESLYSNRSYIVAGAIAERLGRAPWEELMTRRLFRPLDMRSAGFGGMASPCQTDQPWPHLVLDGRHEPIASGPGPTTLGSSAPRGPCMSLWTIGASMWPAASAPAGVARPC